MQGWSDKPVPTHLQIQQILVNIGDKQKDFVGSRRWIGSFEVSYVLDSLLGVTCRMLTVQKGDSISSLAYEVANHFQTHGSPIMIGNFIDQFNYGVIKFPQCSLSELVFSKSNVSLMNYVFFF